MKAIGGNVIGKMVVPIPRTLSRWQRIRRTLHPVRTTSNGSVAVEKPLINARDVEAGV